MTIEQRIAKQVRGGNTRGAYILYWMQQAQRVQMNAALVYASNKAEEMGLPLVVVFVLTDSVPEANLRHYSFMMEGIAEVGESLQGLGYSFYLACGYPPEVIASLAVNAAEVVADMGYLHYQRQWRTELLELLIDRNKSYTEVETEPMVPVAMVSDKEEYAAATIRKKLLKHLNADYNYPESLKPAKMKTIAIKTGILLLDTANMHQEQVKQWWLQHVPTSNKVMPVKYYAGGYSEAKNRLNCFLEDKLTQYGSSRNDPTRDIQSGLSPYLHYGQISAMEIIQQMLSSVDITIADLPYLIMDKGLYDSLLTGTAAFAEELIVRRELSFNYCSYSDNYQCFEGIPGWAKQTLLNHLGDPRERQYSLDRMEQCDTEDTYWNAAQREMVTTGKMHNYMRMYWGKRILAWCESPEDAFQILVYLNNRYELDGRDPNAYAGIAWCFGKHDRPWQERNIYGMVRYMNANGLKRKFRIDEYLSKIDKL